MKNVIDVNFDFTTDTQNYWENFWNDDVLGGSGKDPDSSSPTMKKYHQILWSKTLPNGDSMDLTIGKGSNYLTWNEFRFGADSICASFRYKKNRSMLEQVKEEKSDYHSILENFMHKTYTIGGSIIFPKSNSINCARGCNSQIKDRWDLTLECIRKFYRNESSPLFEVLNKNKDFFDLFVDFKGYVDFFFLQDCVTPNYEKVIFWFGDGDFSKNPIPQTTQDYLMWLNKQLEFVEKRNYRIKKHLESKVILC